MKRFLHFCFNGTLLFVIDYFVFIVLIKHSSIELSRAISMSITAFLAWLINRNTVFLFAKTKNDTREFIYYYSITTIVALINYLNSIYLLKSIIGIPTFVSIGISCLLGAFLNFYLLNKILYRKNNGYI